MKYTGTINELLLIRNDIINHERNFTAFAAFHKQKIIDFKNKNRMAIMSADKKVQGLIKKYVVFEDNKAVQVEGKFQFKNDEDKAAFEVAYAELIHSPVMIEV